MEKQLIISVGREFGSGGHEIAELLAKEFDLPFYDKSLIKKVAEAKDVSSESLERYDEKPRIRLTSRKVRGFSNSPEAHIAEMQFDFIRNLAKEGKSFIIVGRCAETVLKGNKALTSIFVLADMEEKVKRVAGRMKMTPEDAEAYIVKHNIQRKLYHNSHSKVKWGDSRNYDISINSSRLGIQGTAKLLTDYIKDRMAIMN